MKPWEKYQSVEASAPVAKGRPWEKYTQAAPEPAQQPERNILQEDIVRPAARAARATAVGTVGAVGDLAQMATQMPNPIAWGLDKLTGGNVSEKIAKAEASQPRPSEMVGGAIDKFTQGLTAPRNQTERNIDTAGEFLAGGGSGAVADLAKLVVKSPGYLVKAAPKMLGNLAKKSLKNDVLEAAQNQNIRINPAAISDSRTLQFLESRVAQSGLSGKGYDTLMKNLDSDYLNAYTKTLDDVSKETYLNTTDAGAAVQNNLVRRKNAAQRLTRQKYGEAMEKYGAEVLDTPQTLDFIANTKVKLSKTASPSGSKQVVLNKLDEIEQSLAKGNTDIETLINTKTDLNDIINYETQGGVKQYLKGVVHSINKDLQKYGATNPEFATKFKAAEDTAKWNAKTFRNKLVDSLMKKERPEEVLAAINSPSDVVSLEYALGAKPKGRQISQSVKRMKLEELIDTSFIKKQGEIEYGRVARSLAEENKKKNQLIRALAGHENYKNLEELRTVAQGVSDGKRLYNFTNSGNVVQDVGLVVSGVTGAIANPATLAIIGTPYALSKVITSKTLMKSLTGAVKAQKSGNPAMKAAAALSFIRALEKEGVLTNNQ